LGCTRAEVTQVDIELVNMRGRHAERRDLRGEKWPVSRNGIAGSDAEPVQPGRESAQAFALDQSTVPCADDGRAQKFRDEHADPELLADAPADDSIGSPAKQPEPDGERRPDA